MSSSQLLSAASPALGIRSASAASDTASQSSFQRADSSPVVKGLLPQIVTPQSYNVESSEHLSGWKRCSSSLRSSLSETTIAQSENADKNSVQRRYPPYRRMHSASPSYNHHSPSAYTTDPHDRSRYHMDWAHSQPATYNNEILRSYLANHSGPITKKQPSVQLNDSPDTSDTTHKQGTKNVKSMSKPHVMNTDFLANHTLTQSQSLDQEISSDMQRNVLLRRLESTSEVLPPLRSNTAKSLVDSGAYNPSENHNDEASLSYSRISDSKSQLSHIETVDIENNNSIGSVNRTKHNLRKYNNPEIAQTVHQPTVTYSSSTKPPYPLSTNQNRPSTISLHISSVRPNHGTPQSFSKVIEKHNTKYKQPLQYRQGKTNF